MNSFLRWFLGVRQSPDWIAGGQWRLEFSALPQGTDGVVALALALVAVLLVWWLYKVEGRSLRVRSRCALATMRLLVLAVIALMLVEPVLTITKRESVPSRLLVLIDTSQSMGLSDPYPDEALGLRTAQSLGMSSSQGKPDLDRLRKQSRLQLANATLQRLLEQLGKDRQIYFYGFAAKLGSREKQSSLAALKPVGEETALGTAISSALADHRGQPMAGILLVSDGQSNAGEDPREAAVQAAGAGVVIHALAAGTDQGPSNARLVEIETSPVVFVRDPTEVAVLVESHGLQGRSATVSLQQRRDGGPWSEPRQEELTLGEDRSMQRVVFKFTPEQPGQYDFRAHVGNSGAELTDADNSATKSMKAIRSKIRTLLIAGSPSPEVQFLRNAMLRDEGIEFASWLQSADETYEHPGERPIRRLPANHRELEQYDVLILADPDVKSLGAAWPDLLTHFVGEAGGGLVYMAGELFTPQLFSDNPGEAGGDTSWLRILPVVCEPGLFRSEIDLRLSARDTWNLELSAEGTADPIFRFVPDSGRNREILASLPGMYWHFPVTRAKPGAVVLARHGDPRMHNSFGRHVLLAMQRYGPGRTVFIGFDSTYRWRYLHEEYFDGFWARLIDRVGRNKVLGGRYPFTLSADKSVYQIADRVILRAKLTQTDELSPISQIRAEVELSDQTPQPLEFEPLAAQPDVLEASFTATEAGSYTLRAVPGGVGAENDPAVRAATLSFRVELPQRELDNPTLNQKLLEDVTRSAGGKVFSLAEADRLPHAIKIGQVERVLQYRDELWDAPILFGSIVCIITAEWVLRKRYRMA